MSNLIEENSLKKHKWVLGSPDESAIPIFQELGLSKTMATVLATRENALKDPERFVNALIKTNLFNPFELKDMDIFASRLVEAVENRERVAIWGDYDVDGATSSAIMARYLRDLGCRPMIRIPDRFTEGYGPNAAGLRELRDEGASLILVLDSGTTAFDVLGTVVKEGMDVMVMDHHAAEEKLPPVRALVNPNRKDEKPGRGYLCTAGLAFVTCVALKMKLGEKGWFDKNPQPDLMKLLDLAALGTVADVVPLEGLNRALVRTGLQVMARRENVGIKALLEVSGISGAVDPWHLGFLLGPRINAGGRVDDSSLGARLLFIRDEDQARLIAGRLDDVNKERKVIEDKCKEESLTQAEALLEKDPDIPFLYTLGDFHEGVVGIVAGRLKEAYDRPAIVFSKTEEGTLKASARSMPGFDIGQAIIEARTQGILLAGGGHPMAGGLTLLPERLDDFVAFMNEKIKLSEFWKEGVKTYIDAPLDPVEINGYLITEMNKLEPFGQGNPRPRFLIKGIKLERVVVLKDVHLKFFFAIPGLNDPVASMMFSGVGQPFAESLRALEGEYVDVVAGLKRNEWRGNVSVELTIEDARKGSPQEQKKEEKKTSPRSRPVETRDDDITPPPSSQELIYENIF